MRAIDGQCLVSAIAAPPRRRVGGPSPTCRRRRSGSDSTPERHSARAWSCRRPTRRRATARRTCGCTCRRATRRHGQVPRSLSATTALDGRRDELDERRVGPLHRRQPDRRRAGGSHDHRHAEQQHDVSRRLQRLRSVRAGPRPGTDSVHSNANFAAATDHARSRHRGAVHGWRDHLQCRLPERQHVRDIGPFSAAPNSKRRLRRSGTARGRDTQMVRDDHDHLRRGGRPHHQQPEP